MPLCRTPRPAPSWSGSVAGAAPQLRRSHGLDQPQLQLESGQSRHGQQPHDICHRQGQHTCTKSPGWRRCTTWRWVGERCTARKRPSRDRAPAATKGPSPMLTTCAPPAWPGLRLMRPAVAQCPAATDAQGLRRLTEWCVVCPVVTVSPGPLLLAAACRPLAGRERSKLRVQEPFLAQPQCHSWCLVGPVGTQHPCSLACWGQHQTAARSRLGRPPTLAAQGGQGSGLRLNRRAWSPGEGLHEEGGRPRWWA